MNDFIPPHPVIFIEKNINYWTIIDMLNDFYGQTSDSDDYVTAELVNILNNPDTQENEKFELTVQKLLSTRGNREQPVRLARILFRSAGFRINAEQLALR